MFTFPTGLFVPSQSGDPFWANVVFLQNFQGVNGSKPATDQSQYAHALTWNGNAALTTAQSPFPGGSSAAFDGVGDWVQIASGASLSMDNQDFTIEFFAYLITAPLSTHFLAQQSQDFTFQISGSTPGQAIVWDGANRVIGSIPTGAWFHTAITRSSGQVQGFVHGQSSPPWTNTSISRFTLSGGFIGARWNGDSPLNGYIGPIRVTKGVARDVSTVPTAPFPTGP